MRGQTLDRLLIGHGLWVMATLGKSLGPHSHSPVGEAGPGRSSDSWPVFLQVSLDVSLQVTKLVFILIASGG